MEVRSQRESGGLDVIILDDNAGVASWIDQVVREFYAWGAVIPFSDPDQATAYCLDRQSGLAIFIVDVFLGDRSGFVFLDGISAKFDSAQEDAIMITGSADANVVDMCVASNICHLLEKPLRPYALQFAVRAIVTKYQRFAKRLLADPALVRFASSLP